MRKHFAAGAVLIIVVALAVLPASIPYVSMAQVSNPSIIPVMSAPSSCTTLPLKIVQNTNQLYGSDGSGGCEEIGGGGGGAVDSVSNSDGTLTISPTTGAVVASLNFGHANTWTAQQIFNNADIPDATFLNFGTATTGIRSLQVAGQMDFYVLGANVAALGNTGTWQMVTGGGFTWGAIRGTQDTSLYRTAAKTISIGVGGDSTGTLKYALYTPGVIYSAAGTALPTCSSTTKGTTAVVSDATTPTYMSAYTSGGAITAAVICSYDGTTYSWLTH